MKRRVLIFQVALLVLLAVLTIAVPSHGAAISRQAQAILPTLADVLHVRWPVCPQPWVLAGSVEQESAFKEHAELKTSREYGFGLGQITIAYNANGTERFNNFKEAVRVTGMKYITWDKRFDPAFQLSYLVLSAKGNFALSSKFFDDPESRMAGMCVIYNAGPGGILRRKATAASQGQKPPRKWFGGLENVHAPVETRLLYGRPLWKAVNEYPYVILKIRSPKYETPMKKLMKSL